MVAYYPYGYWGVEQFISFDLPLFLLFFGLTIIIMKFIVRIQDPMINTGMAAFSASLAYFLTRSQNTVMAWFYWNSSIFYGLVVLLIIGALIYTVILKM